MLLLAPAHPGSPIQRSSSSYPYLQCFDAVGWVAERASGL